MKIEITEVNGIQIAELISNDIEIKNAQDALEIMMNCLYQGAESIIVQEKNLIPEFFELKTGIAGDILQKFSNYNAKLAIVGSFKDIESKSLRDFIYESNKIGRVNFVSSQIEAKKILTNN